MAAAVQDQTLQLPSLPPHRQRRTGLAIVVAVLAAMAVGGLSLTALRQDTETVRSTAVPPTTVAPAPSTAPPT
ncbi:MAG: peptidoglycan-binding protein, partial [Actinomycetota bacterium]|nr:peptidoglycan-binding protein [Actinomycetota bacterium]